LSLTITEIIKNKDVTIKVLSYDLVNIDTLNLSILTPEELTTFQSFKSEKRQLEFYNCRVLWASFKIESTITYKSTGKPKIEKGFISISHSQHKIAIAYSNQHETGIDLEVISEKVQKVKSKYLHTSESFKTKLDLTTVWTIKEAIYKLYDSDKISFKRDIIIKIINDSPSVNVSYNQTILSPSIQIMVIDEDYILSFAQ
jgi:hypothetical protein